MTRPRKPPTMADLARLTGVSPMTVSRAFKRDSSVSEATRRQILNLAEDLGYVFDATASTLRSQKTNFVAVTIPSLNNANFADTVRGLADGIKDSGLQILLGSTNYDINEEERLIEQLLHDEAQKLPDKGARLSHSVYDGGILRRLQEQLKVQRSDLLVLGSHGRSALSQALLGSLAQHFLHKAPCDVLVVR